MKNTKLLYALVITALVLSVSASGLTAHAYFKWNPFGDWGSNESIYEKKDDEDVQRDQDAVSSIRSLIREESLVITTVAEAQEAVVSVIVTKDLPILERYYEKQSSPFDDFNFFFHRFGDDPFFSPFEFRIPKYREKGTEKKEVGGGTAFFISDDGLLLTNKHVVDDEEAEYTVLLNNEEKLEAEVVARDPGNDIALLKVKGNGYTSLQLTTDEPKLGQTAIAIGNALGEFRNTVSVGVISGLKRSINAGSLFGGSVEHLESIIQTDAAINHGNSGGPLLNLKGEVIGMNTAVAAGAQNIGFAIPSADLHRAIDSYEKHGKIVKAFLGVRYMAITDELKEKNNLKYDYGVLISRGEEASDLAVVPGSPADKAGLQENDIILEIDGKKLDGSLSLAKEIQRKAPGEKVRLKVVSKGKEKNVTVTLEEQE